MTDTDDGIPLWNSSAKPGDPPTHEETSLDCFNSSESELEGEVGNSTGTVVSASKKREEEEKDGQKHVIEEKVEKERVAGALSVEKERQRTIAENGEDGKRKPKRR